MMTTDRRTKTIQGFAWTIVLLLLIVISASAWLRLAQPSVDCAKWPVCRMSAAPDAAEKITMDTGQPRQLDQVRVVHRAAASLTFVIIIALVAVALARKPRDWAAGRPALILAVLAGGLSVLGIFTPGSPAIWVLLGNHLGGFSMLAVAWYMTRRWAATVDDSVGVVLNRWVRIGATLWVLQAALGAVSGAGGVAAVPAALIHAVLAFAAAGLAFGIGAYARRGGLRVEGTALLAVAAAQWSLGIGTAFLAVPLAAVMLHNLGSALGLALLVGLLGRGRPDAQHWRR